MAERDGVGLLYLEPDDEITAAVRRLRDAEQPRVVLVAPGRSKATSSVVALRLLQRAATEAGREVVVVGDALTRSLAADAGLDAYGSVDDATTAQSPAPAVHQRAATHVVRGGESTVARPVAPGEAPAALAAANELTQELPAVRDDRTEVRTAQVARPVRSTRSGDRPRAEGPLAGHRGRGLLAAALGLLVALVAAAAVAAAVILPAATITIVPVTAPVGPARYALRIDDPQVVTGSVETSVTGTASGSYQDLLPATGAATFRNFNTVAVALPAGTRISAGEIVFATTEAVTAPAGQLTAQGTIRGGEVTVPIVAEAVGPSGNVPAEAIDTIQDTQTRNRLRGFPQNSARLVINAQETGGGIDQGGPEIEQADLDAAMQQLTAALGAAAADEVADTEGLVTAAAAEPAVPAIEVPAGLVGTRDQPTFELSGTFDYELAAVRLSEVEAAAESRLQGDASLIPVGVELVPDSTAVTVSATRREGPALVAEVDVQARTVATIDAALVADRVAGMAAEDAETALGDLGAVSVETWPGWVTEVPSLDWRVEVRVDPPG